MKVPLQRAPWHALRDNFAALHPVWRFYSAAFSVVLVGALVGATADFYTGLVVSGIAVAAGTAAFYGVRRESIAAADAPDWGFLRDSIRISLPHVASERESSALRNVGESYDIEIPTVADFGFQYSVAFRQYPVFHLRGRLDERFLADEHFLASVRGHTLIGKTDEHWEVVILELDDVGSVSAGGVEALLDVQHQASEVGTAIRFVSTRPQSGSVLDQIRRSGLKIHMSLSEALTGVPHAQT